MTIDQFLNLPEKKNKVNMIEIKRPMGNDGIYLNVLLMKKVRDKYKKDPVLRTKLLDYLTKYKRKGPLGDLLLLWKLLKRRIRYVNDIFDIETIQTPLYTWVHRGGDCDDMALISATYLEAIGIPTMFKIVGNNGIYTHIFTLAGIRGSWVPFDLTNIKPLQERKGYTISKVL